MVEPIECEKYQNTGICSKQIIFNMPGLIYWADRSGKILGCNNALLQKSNLEPNQVCIEKSYKEIFTKDIAEKFIRLDQQVINTGAPITLEETFSTEDGTQTIYSIKKIPLTNKQGEINGLVSIATNITEQRQIECKLQKAKKKLEMANKAKLEFLSILNRELRTRINSIIGATQLLSIDKLSHKQTEYINLINQSSNNVISLTNYLIDYINLDTGKLEFYEEEFNLKLMLEEKIKKFFHTAIDKGIDDIILDYQPDIPLQIYADAERIGQLLDTFINNSIRFSDSGIIIIRVENIAESPKEGTILKISVIDQGIGIAKEQQTYLFNMFSESLEKQQQIETGFRLSLSKLIVTSMGGSIGVNSELNQGSTFWFTINLNFSPNKIIETGSKWDAYKNKTRILIATDNDALNQVIYNTFETKHNTIEPSKNVYKNLTESYKQHKPYQIVILDHQTKSLDIENLIKKISTSKELDQTLLLLLTTTSDVVYKIHNISTLTKPIIPSELPEQILQRWTLFTRYRPYVLLVEDTPGNQFIERMMLEELGCAVDTAKTGKEALKKVKEKKYNLIFMDLSLPDRNGLEVATEINKDRNAPPIVAVTSYTTEIDNKKFIDSGMYDMIAKPVNIKTFESILKTIIPKYADR